MLLIRGEIRCACSPEEGTVVGVLPDRAGSGEKWDMGLHTPMKIHEIHHDKQQKP